MKREDQNNGLFDDLALVRAFKEGDGEAFTALVTRYQRIVYTVCYRFMNDAQEASDCAQETFLKAFRGVRAFREESSFSTWLHRIARNTCINRLRSPWFRWRRKTSRLLTGDDPEEQRELEIPDRGRSPAQAFTGAERARRVHAAIHALPEDQRVVVILRDIEGQSYEEISVALGVRLGTVKSRLARAREMLYTALQGVIGDDM